MPTFGGFDISGDALASMGTTLIGGYFAAQGAASEARMARNAYQYNASVNRFNARMAGLRAEDALRMGEQQEQQVTRAGRAVKGGQIAAMGSSGIALSSASALDILAGTDMLVAADVNTIEENTRKAVFAEESAAMDFQNRAGFDMASAAGYSPAAARSTSLINTFGQVAGQWYNFSRTGAITGYSGAGGADQIATGSRSRKGR